MGVRPDEPSRTITIDTDVTQRLDVWLTRAVSGLSRRAARAVIAAGAVTVDGRRAVKSECLKRGSIVEICLASVIRLRDWRPKADPSQPILVFYEDEHLAVVEKQSGISSVPLGPDETGCLSNFVVARFPQCASVGRKSGDGGLLQRLDFETSGAVTAALSQDIHDKMAAAQKRGEVEKRYLALVKGAPPLEMCIDTPLAKTGPRGARMRPCKDGAAAYTKVRAISTHGDWTLVEAFIRHGVRHQIRAHLASEGYPVAADPLYGDGDGPRGLCRLFLHAQRISFVHPVSKRSMTVEAPLPQELEMTIRSE